VRRRRREFSIFTLSFLDIMSCGFGAVVLLFMISKHAENTIVEQPSYDFAAEVARLDQEVAGARDALAARRAARAALGADIERARRARSAARAALDAALGSQPSAGGGAEDLRKLRASIRRLESDRRNLLAELNQRSRYVRSYVGEGNREYLTGVRLGGQRILVLLDTSASMLDDSIVGVIRKRNMDVETQRRSRKWQQALATVEWIAAHFPRQAQFQLVGFNSAARAGLPASDGRWLAVADSAALDGAIAGLREVLPQGGSSLDAAFDAINAMTPLPDNVYLITDGLPTQGRDGAHGATVSGLERQRLFEAAVERMPRGMPINVILLPMEGDPMAPTAYWQIARVTNGSFLTPSEDWP
jgi:hypothetical protein